MCPLKAYVVPGAQYLVFKVAFIRHRWADLVSLTEQKKVLFRCFVIWENGRLRITKLISSAKPIHNPTILSKTKTKASAQSSYYIVKYHPLKPAGRC